MDRIAIAKILIMKLGIRNVHVINCNIIIACSSICFNCKTLATNCTECDSNLFRVLSGNTCICATRFGTKQLSYYDNLLDPECVGKIIL